MSLFVCYFVDNLRKFIRRTFSFISIVFVRHLQHGTAASPLAHSTDWMFLTHFFLYFLILSKVNIFVVGLNLIMTSIGSERINVTLTRIVSPTEFWIKIKTGDGRHESYSDIDFDQQKTHRDYLRWIKGTECIFKEETNKQTKNIDDIYVIGIYFIHLYYRPSRMEMSFGISCSDRLYLLVIDSN